MYVWHANVALASSYSVLNKKKILECLENDTMLNIMSVNLCQRTLNFKQQNRKEVFLIGKIENEWLKHVHVHVCTTGQ